MKTKIERYCIKIQKETEKILYKLFGMKKTIKEWNRHLKEWKENIEYGIKKPIEEISALDLKSSNHKEIYARYKTLEKILNIYTESACLNLSNMEE